MEKLIKGKAFVLGNNIDTDQIIPAEHLVLSIEDPKERELIGKYALSGVPIKESGLPEGNIPFVKENEYKTEFTFIIGGTNFGCGSSREYAPFALSEAGAKVIVSESYARIFFRNAVDGGFIIPYETYTKINNEIKTYDELELNMEENILINLTTSVTYKLKPLGDILPILEAGNLFEYARQSGMLGN